MINTTFKGHIYVKRERKEEKRGGETKTRGMGTLGTLWSRWIEINVRNSLIQACDLQCGKRVTPILAFDSRLFINNLYPYSWNNRDKWTQSRHKMKGNKAHLHYSESHLIWKTQTSIKFFPWLSEQMAHNHNRDVSMKLPMASELMQHFTACSCCVWTLFTTSTSTLMTYASFWTLQYRDEYNQLCYIKQMMPIIYYTKT